MMKPRPNAILGAIAAGVMLVGIAACAGRQDAAVSTARAEFTAEHNKVDTMSLSKVDFCTEIVSNGTLVSSVKADIKFKAQGVLTEVFVKNGSRVEKGESIAALDTRSLQMALEKSSNTLERATLDLYDILIGYGYGADTTQVPADQLKIAKIRSGYASAEHDFRDASLNLENATLRAPFSGVVANLTARPFEQSGERVCTLLDNSVFNVTFSVLESEVNAISVGQGVRIIPYADASSEYAGRITQINPLIDDRGQVSVIAAVTNTGGCLMDGMNVKVLIESRQGRQFVVPKSAVVNRDGYDVVFIADMEACKARWLYVDIVKSNSTHHVISGSRKKGTVIEEGVIIITGGNLNLAEGSNIEVR